MDINNRRKIKFIGVNQNKIFKIIDKHNISICNVSKLDYKTIECEISNTDFNNLKTAFKNTNFKIEEGENKSKNFFKKRWGLFVGAFLGVLLFLIASQFVWRVDVVGLDKIPYGDFINELKQQGVKVGSIKNAIDTENVKKNLCEKFSNISLISVVKKGSCIIFNIKETLYVEELDNVGEGSNIIAEYDCTILEIELYQGTANCKVGDSVKRGSVLVYGYEQIAGSKVDCFANAKVRAEAVFTETVIYDTKGTTLKRTGRKAVESKIYVLDRTINLNNPHSFKYYEQEVEEKYLFKNLLLPIKIKQTTTYELQEIANVEDFDLIKPNLEQKAVTLAEKKLSNSLQKTKSFCIINNINNVYYVTAYVTALWQN